MQVITEPTDLVPFHGCAFVPTMGALHKGHLSLIDRAKASGAAVLVSIFVNPEQFAPDEDFQRYPRHLEQDISLAREAGADAVFAPEVGAIYPQSDQVQHLNITLPPSATRPKLEDACRPTHFRGVCLVVARLFDLVRPAIAVFGEKDYQQYVVIRQLVEQEGSRWEGLRIVGAPIVRDDDGLAMSSRNVYLCEAERTRALGLHRAIECTSEPAMRAVLEDHGLDIEYAVVRDEATLLEPIEGKPARALVAANVGGIRLIDNARVDRT